MPLRIIACGVFRDALNAIAPGRFRQNVAVSYISPCLHNHPARLFAEIERQIRLARAAKENVVCVFGQCAPDLDPLLDKLKIPRVPGAHCYEILLSSRRFRKVMDEEAGTYFLEKELIQNFTDYCVHPLELDDPMLRESYFQHYKRVAYVRQPEDPDHMVSRVKDIARMLNLSPITIDADYSELKKNLLKLFSD
ncbi:MAG: DUF1638 domain-containing protein [Pseudomonadota bacterium]